MGKIIDINTSVVSIGMPDGGIKEVRVSDLNFVANIGDEVEIYETETKIIVTKSSDKTSDFKNAGISISMNQNIADQNLRNAASNTKAVNKVAYCILALLLGGLGVHKFYVGKVGTGILFVLFCWTGIPLIISIVDAIVAFCKKSDANGMIIV